MFRSRVSSLAALIVVALTCAALAESAPGPSRKRGDAVAFFVLHRWEVATPLWIWPAGHTIEGCFKSGTSVQRALLVGAAREWMRHANITFDFGAAPDFRDCAAVSPPPPLRVLITAGDSSAKLGTTVFDTLEIEPTVKISPRATLNGKVYSEADLRAVMLHELGHVLGIRHEHQHPASRCVDAYAWTALCSRVDKLKSGTQASISRFAAVNLVPRIAQAGAAMPRYDPKSIMHYKFTGTFLKSQGVDCSGGTVTALSEGDKARAALLYPQSREAQLRLIESQQSIIAAAIAATPRLTRVNAERIATEAARLVSLGHPDVVFKVGWRLPSTAIGQPLEMAAKQNDDALAALVLGEAADVGRICKPDVVPELPKRPSRP